eukprot:6188510-Pleurochrysis_carterae.AAC.2
MRRRTALGAVGERSDACIKSIFIPAGGGGIGCTTPWESDGVSLGGWIEEDERWAREAVAAGEL